MTGLMIAGGYLIAPYYSEPAATVYLGKAEKLMTGFARDSFGHLFLDPPYSAHTQKNVKTSAKSKATKRAGGGKDLGNVKLGFAPLSPQLRRSITENIERLATGYSLIFTDEGGFPDWKKDILRSGLELVRCCYWIRHAAPQMTGDRPAAGAEMILAVHRPGKKVWNGGGKDGIYPYPIVKGTPAEPRLHETQKPLALMMALVADFSQPGARILDCCAGSGTTLDAAKRLGRLSVGISDREEDVQHCRQRLRQEVLAGGRPPRRSWP